jgi:hypothetical protein
VDPSAVSTVCSSAAGVLSDSLGVSFSEATGSVKSDNSA